MHLHFADPVGWQTSLKEQIQGSRIPSILFDNAISSRVSPDTFLSQNAAYRACIVRAFVAVRVPVQVSVRVRACVRVCVRVCWSEEGGSRERRGWPAPPRK